MVGQVDVSRQLFDRTPPAGFDEVLAAELGAELASKVDTQLIAGAGTATQNGFGRVLQTPCIPTNLGVTTNEDAVVSVATEQLRVYADVPRIRVQSDVGSGTLTVRLQAQQRVCIVSPQPLAIAKLTGTGLVPPTFTA